MSVRVLLGLVGWSGQTLPETRKRNMILVGFDHDASVGPATRCPRFGSQSVILCGFLPRHAGWAGHTLPETGE